MVEKKILIVKWDETALQQLEKAYKYIKRDSVKNANKVRKAIFDLTMSLAQQPEKYPLDKNKVNNDGSYRAFEKYKYRIAYKVTSGEIKILSVRHASMEPLNY